MFAHKPLPTDLMSVTEAKRLFISALAPRIKAYESILEKPWFERAFEYIKTEYGLAGYKRTKEFLAEIEGDSITCLKNLIDLTAKEKYQEGRTMSRLLKCIVLDICNFEIRHVKFAELIIIRSVRDEASQRMKHIKLISARYEAIKILYEKVIASDDCGQGILADLNYRMLTDSLAANNEMKIISR